MLKYQLFPKTQPLTDQLLGVIEVFNAASNSIDSMSYKYSSNEVLKHVLPGLKKGGYNVEAGQKAADKILVPVFFGLNGKPEKSFNADAVSNNGEIVIEIEAGRAYTNHQFLKDIFQAAMMVDVKYLVIAVRNTYRLSDDFTKIYRFIDLMFSSDRIRLKLEGILLIGY